MNVSEMTLEDLRDHLAPDTCGCTHCRSVQYVAGKIAVRRRQVKSIVGQRFLFSDDIHRTTSERKEPEL